MAWDSSVISVFESNYTSRNVYSVVVWDEPVNKMWSGNVRWIHALQTNWSRHQLMLLSKFVNFRIVCTERSKQNNWIVFFHKMQDLVNIDVFITAWEVEQSLDRRECDKCLAWCHENRSRLRRLKSGLEFSLHVQQFIELIRNDRRLDAVRWQSVARPAAVSFFCPKMLCFGILLRRRLPQGEVIVMLGGVLWCTRRDARAEYDSFCFDKPV